MFGQHGSGGTGNDVGPADDLLVRDRPQTDVSDVVRTKRLEIVDDRGDVRVELGVSEVGDSIVRLRDDNGIVRAAVTIQHDSPRVRLLDATGQIRLCAILRDGQPGIELLDATGRPRLVLFLRGTDGESPDIFFADAEGEPRFVMALDDAGTITLARAASGGALSEPIWISSSRDSEDEPLG